MNNKVFVPITAKTVRDKVYQIERDKVLLQVVLDKDLADYYGVEVKRLTELVGRTQKRGSSLFEGEFFQLTREEWNEILGLRSHFATSKNIKEYQSLKRGYLPKVYTARGAIAVSKIITSDRADEVYKVLVDAFIYQQSVKAGNLDVSIERFEALERRVDKLELKEHIPPVTNNTFQGPTVYVAGNSNGDIIQELENQISIFRLLNQV